MKASEKEPVIFRLDPKMKKKFQLKLLKENTTQQEWLDKQVQKYLKEDEKK